jgi:hypothetical protein
MKIYPCSKKEQTTQPADLTWDEILSQEGIYKSTSGEGHVVVLRDRYSTDELAVFYVSGDGNYLEPCMGIKSSTFKKVDRQLCFEIR